MCKTNLLRLLQQLDEEEANLTIQLDMCDAEYEPFERYRIQMRLEILAIEKQNLLLRLNY